MSNDHAPIPPLAPIPPMPTATHTYTVEHFADPFKKCMVCGAWVDGYIVAPYQQEDRKNWPCRHRGYENLCPSWSPVDGCRCAEHLGSVDHPVRTGRSVTRSTEGR